MALGLRLTGQALSRAMLQSTHLPSASVAVNRRWYSEMPLTFASAFSVFYNGDSVKQIDVPSFSGSFGILPNHVPTMAALKPGVVAVTEADGNIAKYFVSSGTVTINADSTVQLLAEEACLLADIDAHAAREVLTSVIASVSSAKDDREKAEAQIALEAAEAIVKAIS